MFGKKMILGLVVLVGLMAALLFSGEGLKNTGDEETIPPVDITEKVEDPKKNNEEALVLEEVENEETTAEKEDASEEKQEEIKVEITDKDNTLSEPENKEEIAENDVKTGVEVPLENEGEFYCTVSVRCDTILNNLDKLAAEKQSLIPENGVILGETEVLVYEGETVFNVLLREMKLNKIHMEYMDTPIYNSAYIEGINNIYEFDCGALSGWMYAVNGWFPNFGPSQYTLEKGDVISWVYTCDLGVDIGGGESAKGQIVREEEPVA